MNYWYDRDAGRPGVVEIRGCDVCTASVVMVAVLATEVIGESTAIVL